MSRLRVFSILLLEMMFKAFMILLSFLPLSCASQVHMHTLEGKVDLFDVIEKQAKASNAPAFNTSSAYDPLSGDGWIYSGKEPLKWTALNGFNVLHALDENLKNISVQAKKNEIALSEVADKEFLSSKGGKFEGAGTALQSMFYLFKSTCKIKATWSAKAKTKMTVHTAGNVKYTQLCKMIAWAYASHGIAFEIDKENPDTLILRDADTSS